MYCLKTFLLQTDNTPLGYLPPGARPIPVPFLAILCDTYEKVVLGGRRMNEAMEFGAFTEMLHSRISIRADGAILFRLYPEFGLGSCPEGLLVMDDDSEVRRLTCG